MMSIAYAATIGAQHYDPHDHMDGWGWMWLGGLLWLIILGAFVGLIVWLVVRSSGQSPTAPHGEEARGILAERFARGEIDEDEFTRRTELLR
jgi:putative membrane protein